MVLPHHKGLHLDARTAAGLSPWKQPTPQEENINNGQIGKSSGKKWVEVNGY